MFLCLVLWYIVAIKTFESVCVHAYMCTCNAEQWWWLDWKRALMKWNYPVLLLNPSCSSPIIHPASAHVAQLTPLPCNSAHSCAGPCTGPGMEGFHCWGLLLPSCPETWGNLESTSASAGNTTAPKHWEQSGVCHACLSPWCISATVHWDFCTKIAAHSAGPGSWEMLAAIIPK